MKTIHFILCVLLTCTLFAQKKHMTPGTYISDKDNITIQVNEDNTFSLVFLQGKYTVTNDTIYFGNSAKGNDSFIVRERAQKENKDSITITVQSEYMYYLDRVYLGVAKDEEGKVIYQSIESYVKTNRYDGTGSEEYNFTIPKTTELYLVESGYKRNQPTISNYAISTNTSNIDIVYKPSKMNDLELKGYYEEETGKFAVTDGKRPLLFSKANAIPKTDKGLTPISVNKDEFWKAPDQEEEVVPDTVIAHEAHTAEVAKQVYKPVGSLKKAIQALENTTGKYVVVSYDPDAAKGQKDFTEYTNVYGIHDSIFIYYLAQSKDKKLFENLGVAASSGIVVLNSDSKVLYYTPGTLTAQRDRFSGYYSIQKEANIANSLVNFDALLSQKKVTVADQRKAIMLLDGLEEDYRFKENYIESKGQQYTPKRAYFYQLQSSTAKINEAWGATLEDALTKDQVDEELLRLAKEELDRRGFMYKMYNTYDQLCSSQDLLAIRYLLKFYDTLATEGNKGCCGTPEASNAIKRKDVDRILLGVFSRNMNSYNNPPETLVNAIKPLFKEYISVTNNDYKAVHSYVYTLKKEYEQYKEEYYTTYNDFYQSYFKEGANIFESLNTIYSASASASNTSWADVKYAIANTANTVAWSIVEQADQETKGQWIDKAIQWSEMSIQITPDSPYYLDTLAQLYYQHGDTEKAIAMQEKARNAGEKQLEPESSVLVEIKKVLEKMKDGTY